MERSPAQILNHVSIRNTSICIAVPFALFFVSATLHVSVNRIIIAKISKIRGEDLYC